MTSRSGRQVQRWLLCGVLALPALAIPGCSSQDANVASKLMGSQYELANVECTKTDARATDPDVNKDWSSSFSCTFDRDPEWGTTQAVVELGKDGEISVVSFLGEGGEEMGRTVNVSF